MDQITEQDKQIGQHLARLVTAQDTPNYRRVLSDNEKYIAVEIAKVRKDARVSSDADKARIAELLNTLENIVAGCGHPEQYSLADAAAEASAALAKGDAR